jgi:hypothetical protein
MNGATRNDTTIGELKALLGDRPLNLRSAMEWIYSKEHHGRQVNASSRESPGRMLRPISEATAVLTRQADLPPAFPLSTARRPVPG